MNRYWQVTMEDRALAKPAALGVSGLYTEHFGLSTAPFSLTPNRQFFFSGPSSVDALNTLILAARSGEGFTKVVGEVGTGKTMLCRMFLAALDKQFVTAYIPNPYLEPMTLLLAIADELGVKYDSSTNQHQLLRALTDFLIETFAAQQRTVVVCLDEAHAMPTESLEALRLLSNLETEKRKLLQIVLFGQPELDVRLAHPAVRQLRQRITFAARLQPMTRTQVMQYIPHRLEVAGYVGEKPLFNARALETVYYGSDGIPRLINILAHKSLVAAFGEGRAQVEPRHVRLAIDDTESSRERYRSRRQRHAAMITAAAGGMLSCAWLLGSGL